MLFLILIQFTNTVNISKSVINDVGNCSTSDGIWIQEIGNEAGKRLGGFGVSSSFATRGMQIYDGELYVGTQSLALPNFPPILLKLAVSSLAFIYKSLHSTPFSNLIWRLVNYILPLNVIFNDGCEVWKYNQSEDKWYPIISDSSRSILPAGFGNQNNIAASILIPFNEKLYMGTWAGSGCEIYEYDGQQFKKVVKKGFGNRFNSGAWSAKVYNEELFVGTMNWKQGCQMWKTKDGKNWEQVPLPGGNGFGTRWSIYLWSMEIYDNSLYVGTCNVNDGAQLWKYTEGSWEKVLLPGGDGFGTSDNYGIRNIVEHDGELWISTATNAILDSEACEIWKYDGETWTNIIGEEGMISDGFGDLYNKYAWSMIEASDNSIWVGTCNLQSFSGEYPGSSKGCEIWRYDGNDWKEIVGDSEGSDLSSGFGSYLNMGARSMIEYPENSGIIWIGTFSLDIKDFKTFAGCEIWKRI